jgi:methylase of polypeptide subunit release factors
MPLTIGSADEFRALRDGLRAADFTEEAICRRTGFSSIFDFEPLKERQTAGEISDALDALIRLLMDEEVLDESQAAHLPPGMLANLESLGVVERLPGPAPRIASTVVLYPVHGLYAASDRTFQPKGFGRELPKDVVYAAITKNTARFLSVLPPEPCGDFLDLCAGTGIGAMLAVARGARHAWAADLGLRSVHFADFNGRLNGLDQMSSVQGDLYGAVEGLMFDRIVAHPPYIPNPDRSVLFNDGGEDGEQILARVVQGLPRHLRAGGRFYCVTRATDREGEPFEQRIRRWLGEQSAEFDVMLVATELSRKPEKLIEAVVKAKGRLGDLQDSTKLFEKLKVTAIFYGTVVVERKTAARPAVTGRTQKAATAGGNAVEWFRKWKTAAAGDESILGARLRMAPHVVLQVTHKPQDGALTPVAFELRCAYPLSAEASVEPWIAMVLGACDGSSTAREVLASLKEQQVIDEEFSEAGFTDMLRVLVSNGFLEHPEFPLPS